MKDICILGAGVSGLALAANLKNKEFEILEKSDSSGGLCSTIIESGFTFDIAGPHILFSKNQEVLNYMVSILGDNVDKKFRNSKILYKGCIIKYPFENGLSDLPKEDCFECIYDYIFNKYNKDPVNLEEWGYSTFGKSIAEKYFLPYNKKIWNCCPSKISLHWVSRIPKPPMEDVLKSAVGVSTEGYLHQLYFFYPKNGGYQSLTNAFTSIVSNKISYNQEVININKLDNGWKITTKEGDKLYKNLISTIPMHKLINIWENCPEEAKEAVDNLHTNGLINVLIGFKEDKHIPYFTMYIPDPNIEFHRLTFLKNFSNSTVPDGCASVMAEITANNTDEFWQHTNEEIINKVISDLEKINIINKDQVLYTKVIKINNAYPLYNLDYSYNINKLYDIFKKEELHIIGRFARFEYINSDVCIEQALNLADKLNGN